MDYDYCFKITVTNNSKEEDEELIVDCNGIVLGFLDCKQSNGPNKIYTLTAATSWETLQEDFFNAIEAITDSCEKYMKEFCDV